MTHIQTCRMRQRNTQIALYQHRPTWLQIRSARPLSPQRTSAAGTASAPKTAHPPHTQLPPRTRKCRLLILRGGGTEQMPAQRRQLTVSYHDTALNLTLSLSPSHSLIERSPSLSGIENVAVPVPSWDRARRNDLHSDERGLDSNTSPPVFRHKSSFKSKLTTVNYKQWKQFSALTQRSVL